MKRFISTILILLALFAGVITAQFLKHSTGSVLPAKIQPSLAPTKEQTVQPGIPVSFSIPKLGINTNVQSVGEDSLGRMDVPSNNTDVAWFKLGFKPGQTGSAVIDGHYDTVTGAPAVFYYLKNLQPGDVIDVTDNNGKKYEFTVSDEETYPYNQVPLKQVFATADKSRLNLITCSGTWDVGSHNYSTRTVVYTVLSSIQ